MHNLIKKVVNEEIVLREKAKTIQELEKENLALLITDDAGDLMFVLYEPSKMQSAFDKYSKYALIYAIKGMMAIRKNEKGNFYHVLRVAANRGYGPTLYDVAMSRIKPLPLAADRNSTSEDAQRVWEYMYHERQKDFNLIPLPTTDEEFGFGVGSKNKEFLQDNPVFQYAYEIKVKRNLSKLIKANDSFFNSNLRVQDKLRQTLKQTADMFFNDLYE
jgi:TfoX/Sxy family transcriptional regulator of competence genes